MTLFDNLVKILAFEWKEPKTFGIYHFLCVLALATAVFFIFVRRAPINDKSYRRSAAFLWAVMVLLEMYKQLVFSYTPGAGWDYSWYSFPFQLCSSPLYILPFVAFLPDGRVRQACMAFLATYSLFGGLCVFAYPDTVFVKMVGVNFQTMVHHGIQIFFGILTVVVMRSRIDRRFYLGATAVFCALVCVAMLLNFSVYEVLQATGRTDVFNMFFISPYFNSDLPIFSTAIYPKVPYPVFLVVYIFGFALASFIIFMVEYQVSRNTLSERRYERAKAKHS